MSNLNLRRFAQAKLCRHLKSVVGGGGLKGVGSDFAIQAPTPLTRRLNLMHNAKFNQLKFNIIKVRVSVRKI